MPDTFRAHLAWFVGDAAGARARATAVVPHLASVRVTLVTVGPGGPLPVGLDGVVELPWEARTPRLRTWLATDRPDLLVVDGSAAVASTARAVGVPTVLVRRPGAGPGPTLAPTGAGELAPYPSLLEPSTTPRWLRERTVHAGLISRYAGRRANRAAARRALGVTAQARVVTVMCGRDGLGPTTDLVAAAAATPGWTWIAVGRCGSPGTGLPANLHRLGWRDDPWRALEAADVVVASGALSAVAEVASARRPLVVVPRPGRSDDVVHGRFLVEHGASMAATWPEPAAWADLLSTTAAADPASLSSLEDGRGAARAADWLAAWAQSPPLGAPAGRAAHTSIGQRGEPAAGRVLDLRDAAVGASVRRR